MSVVAAVALGWALFEACCAGFFLCLALTEPYWWLAVVLTLFVAAGSIVAAVDAMRIEGES